MLVGYVAFHVRMRTQRTSKQYHLNVNFIQYSDHHRHQEKALDFKVIRTLEPMDGEPLVLALVAPQYEIHQCRWLMMIMKTMTALMHPILRVTIPASENGDVITVIVEDGLVFNSGVSTLLP